MTPLTDFHQILIRHFEFNAWATARMLPAIRSLTKEEFTKPCGGSFGSLQGICAHAIWVGELWLSRWRELPASTVTPVGQLPMDAGQLADRWVRIDLEMLEFVRSQNDIYKTVRMTNSAGETHVHGYSDMFLHTVNHQSYHRGQITHVLRDLGYRVEGQDLITFLRQRDAK